jgi:hypothetical protein
MYYKIAKIKANNCYFPVEVCQNSIEAYQATFWLA